MILVLIQGILDIQLQISNAVDSFFCKLIEKLAKNIDAACYFLALVTMVGMKEVFGKNFSPLPK